MEKCENCAKRDECPSVGAGDCSEENNGRARIAKEPLHKLSKIKKVFGI